MKSQSMKLMLTFGLVATMLLGLVATSFAAPQRIVVLPFYVEKGSDASSDRLLHYRRTMRFINNRLDQNGFEVINPFAKENIEKEYDRVMERAREDSVLAVREVCEKYAVDAAYLVWLKVKVKHTADNLFKTSVILEGEGYDAAGHDLGVGLMETFKVTRRDRDESIMLAEKWAGDQVGGTLTSWGARQQASGAVATTSVGNNTGGGLLANKMAKHASSINVRLDGATDWQVTEVFGKVVNTVTGVTEAKRYGGNIVPNNPQASYAAWRLQIEDTEPFRLQSNIMKMVKDVINAGGELTLKGVPYRYTAEEVALLKGLRPGKANAQQVQFVVDRNQKMKAEMGSGKGFQ